MARFILTRPAVLNTSGGVVVVPAGEIDSAHYLNFQINPNATVVEDDSAFAAHQMLANECDRVRRTIKPNSGDGNDIPGFGSATALPEQR